MEYLYLDYLHHLSVHSWEIHSKHFPVSGGEDFKGLEGHEAKLEGRQTMDAPAQELLHLGVPVSVTAPRTAPSTAAIDWRQRRLDAAASASAPAAVAASATRSVMAMEWPGGGGGGDPPPPQVLQPTAASPPQVLQPTAASTAVDAPPPLVGMEAQEVGGMEEGWSGEEEAPPPAPAVDAPPPPPFGMGGREEEEAGEAPLPPPPKIYEPLAGQVPPPPAVKWGSAAEEEEEEGGAPPPPALPPKGLGVSEDEFVCDIVPPPPAVATAAVGGATVGATDGARAGKQGWIYSKEPKGKKVWHKRWAVISPGQLALYEDEAAAIKVMEVSLKECRVEKMRARDGHVQKDCDFEYAIRLVLEKKGFLSSNTRVFAATSEEERGAWGAALMSCREGKLEVYPVAYATPAAAAAAAAAAKGMMQSAGQAWVDGMLLESDTLLSHAAPGAPPLPLQTETLPYQYTGEAPTVSKGALSKGAEAAAGAGAPPPQHHVPLTNVPPPPPPNPRTGHRTRRGGRRGRASSAAAHTYGGLDYAAACSAHWGGGI